MPYSISEEEMTKGDNQLVIGGKIKNNTNEREGFTIIYDLYSKDGEWLGSALGVSDEMEGGESVAFGAVGTERGIETPVTGDNLSSFIGTMNSISNSNGEFSKANQVDSYQIKDVLLTSDINEIARQEAARIESEISKMK